MYIQALLGPAIFGLHLDFVHFTLATYFLPLTEKKTKNTYIEVIFVKLTQCDFNLIKKYLSDCNQLTHFVHQVAS